MDETAETHVVFADQQLLRRGPLEEVVEAALDRIEEGGAGRVALFDCSTGHPVDLDLRLPREKILEDLRRRLEAPIAPAEKRGRGRPRLGVVSREVSLLPRHWDWLQLQGRSASATLRRLIDEERRRNPGREQRKQVLQAAYSFMADMAGDAPGFEEASRALFAGDLEGFRERIASWPEGIRDQLAHTLARLPPEHPLES